MTFRLTRKAEGDVIEIYRYTTLTFGVAQADAYYAELQATFQLIARQPYIARARAEIDPPVRIHRHGPRVVIYVVSADESVLIVRVRHGREDWLTDTFEPD